MNEDSEIFLKDRQIIGFYEYPLSIADGEMVLDVAHAHEAVIAKRKGRLEILEEPEIKRIKAQLKRKSDELEERVAERTRQLDQLIIELKKENAERKKQRSNLKNHTSTFAHFLSTCRIFVKQNKPVMPTNFMMSWVNN